MSMAARRLQRSVWSATSGSIYSFGFEAGTVGTSVSTTTTASGDTAWNAIGIGAGSSLIYDTTHTAHGLQSAMLVPTSTSTVMRWTTSPSLHGAFRYYVWWDSYPTADTFSVWFGSDSSTKVASVNLSTAGNVRAYGTPIPSAYSSPNAYLPLGGWARVEVAYQIDSTNSANGKLRLALYAGDSTTAIADSGWVTTDLGTAGITFVRVGKYSSDANTATHWIDSITFDAHATDLLGPANPAPASHDWSDTNLPWAYSSTSEFTADWPGDVSIVDIQTASGDFYTNLKNTCDAAPGRVVVRLGTGTYHLNQFRMIGTSGDPTYAFGFWHSKLQGFLGDGPDKTFIQMDADSMSTDQLTAMQSMTAASFAPNQMGFMRIDGASGTSTIYIAGVTFQAEDQQDLTAIASDLVAKGVVVPQPAPHNGIVINQNANARISYTRFRAAGRAMYSAPPFEHANVSSQYGDIVFTKCESDGRRAPEIDPAQPRRCTVVMGNNEDSHTMIDCWLHHTNLSRYAVNDENRDTSGPYTLIRCKIDHIADTQNRDPALNGGVTLGGYSDPNALGWESVNGIITMTDCIVSQDNPYTTKAIPLHVGLTSTGSRNPQGGRMYINGGEYRNTAYPHLDGYFSARISSTTYWALDGYDTTIDVRDTNGNRKIPYVYSGSWPPSAATLSAAGVTPETHYLIR